MLTATGVLELSSGPRVALECVVYAAWVTARAINVIPLSRPEARFAGLQPGRRAFLRAGRERRPPRLAAERGQHGDDQGGGPGDDRQGKAEVPLVLGGDAT
jgi:hypothetical protein